MRSIICGVIVLSALTVASAADLTGTWKMWPAGEMPEDGPSKIAFDFEVHGGQISGMAYMGAWGGMSRILAGNVDGDHFSFTVNRKSPKGTLLSKAVFEGTVEGKTLKVMVHDQGDIPLEGERVESKVLDPVSVNATAQEVSGEWTLWFVCPVGIRPQMFDRIELTLKVVGDQITGRMLTTDWPGDVPITEGRYEAGHFTLDGTGKQLGGGSYPHLHVEGTIHGEAMKATLEFGSTLPMDGKKMR